MSNTFATDAELEALVSVHARKAGEPFKPIVYYNAEGDSIEFIFAEEDHYSERIDGFVTVMVGIDTGQIVGSVIKGISTRLRQLVEQRPRVSVEIHDGDRIQLAHLFEAQECLEDEPARRIVYRRLQKAAREANAVAELCSV